ncbi:hypothetical protein ACFHWW_26755 [Ensifer sp. P24N7]|uniref:hypothetical protein n=1 Tax=Sinorhizobium sp. P24N7 TaxID=3348358 RepID=UPI0035F484D8
MAKNTTTIKHTKTGTLKVAAGRSEKSPKSLAASVLSQQPASGRSGKSAKALAASVLSQQPATKRAHISQADADRAVGAYLSRTKK